MKKENLSRIFKEAGIILAALALTVGVASAAASFTEPSSAPPGGNVPAPVNVGSVSQVKSGGFWAQSVGSDNGYCIGSSCVTKWWPTPTDITTGPSTCNGRWCMADAATAAKVCELNGYSHLVGAIAGGDGTSYYRWNGSAWQGDSSCTSSCHWTELTRVTCDNP